MTFLGFFFTLSKPSSCLTLKFSATTLLAYKSCVSLANDVNNLACPKLIWSFAGDTQANSRSYSASPSAYKGQVFFPFSSGTLYAVDSTNGSVFWKKTFSSAAIGEGSSLITDFGSSPILLKTGVLASSFSGQTILIDFDGNIIWASDIGTSTSPLIVGSDAFFIDKNGFRVPVFEVKVDKQIVLYDQNKDLLKQEKETVSVDGVNGPSIKLGSLTEVSTNGNWPTIFDAAQ